MKLTTEDWIEMQLEEDVEQWISLPGDILHHVFTYLPSRSLVNSSAVCRWWRSVSRQDRLWRPIFLDEFHSVVSQAPVCHGLADEYGMIKRGCPSTLVEIVDDFGYVIDHVTFSPFGSFYAVCGRGAALCLYESERRSLVEERDLNKSLGWRSIQNASFSPDEMILLIEGEKSTGQTEMATYRICLAEMCLHFVCRLPSSSHFSTWFDNDWILANEVYPINLSSSIAKSISNLILYKSHLTQKEAQTEPETLYLHRFLNQEAPPFNAIVCETVSPRFRRVVQMAREAVNEGKSLNFKMSELQLIDEELNEDAQMNKLKELLDRDEKCFNCYLHEQDECQCACHVLRQECLLIYGRKAEGAKSCISFNIIDFIKMREEAKGEDRNKSVELRPDDDLYSFLSRNVSRPDHEITLDGRLIHLQLSSDHSTLYAAIDSSITGDMGQIEIRSFDLRTMVHEKRTFYGGLQPNMEGREGNYHPSLTSTSTYFLFCCSGTEVVVWSRVHRGPVLTRLQHPNSVRAVAAHPQGKFLVAAVDDILYIWTPAFAQ